MFELKRLNVHRIVASELEKARLIAEGFEEVVNEVKEKVEETKKEVKKEDKKGKE